MSVLRDQIGVILMLLVLIPLEVIFVLVLLDTLAMERCVVSVYLYSLNGIYQSTLILSQAAEMVRFFCMMVVHSLLTTPMELYWFVWTMSMVLCVMTGGTLWMPLLSVLSWDSYLLVCSIICG